MPMTTTVLEGDARFVRLPALLQLAENELHTGRIRLAPGGVVELAVGQVVRARTDDGLEAMLGLHELFFVESGRFTLELDDSVRGPSLGPTIGLIMDACKLLDDWTQLSQERWILAESTLVGHEREADVTQVRPLLSAMARGLTLGQAHEEARQRGRPISRSTSTPALLRLIDCGLIIPMDPNLLAPPPLPAESRRAATPEVERATVDVDEMLVRARRCLKENALDDAESLLRQAIALRPNDRVIAQNLRQVAFRKGEAAPLKAPPEAPEIRR
jgi:hypothetical protein